MPQHSQDLLRAARSGKIWGGFGGRRPGEEDEGDARDGEERENGEKEKEKKSEDKVEGFSVRTWKLVPKHAEGPEIEYLAKRRKGLRGNAIKPTTGPTLTKMTVRKTDESGNSFIEHVVVPEGVKIEGEVIASTVVTDPSTVGVSDAAAPVKRRPPPPKRKPKGPGRGRKKKVLAPTSAPVEGAPAETPATSDGTPVSEGVKKEGTLTPAVGETEDVEMGEGSQASDEEGSEDDGEEEGEIVESPTPCGEQPTAMEDVQASISTLPPPPPGLPPKPTFNSFADAPAPVLVPAPARAASAGSPLKNEISSAPGYSPTVSLHNDEAEAEGDLDDAPPTTTAITTTEAAATEAPALPPQGELQHHAEILPNSGTVISGVAELAGRTISEAVDTPSAGSDMLLDSASDVTGQILESDTLPTVALTSEPAEPAPAKPAETKTEIPEAEAGASVPVAEEPKIASEAGDAFEDLLGGLEDNLEQQSKLLSRENSAAQPASKSASVEPSAPAEVEESEPATKAEAGEVGIEKIDITEAKVEDVSAEAVTEKSGEKEKVVTPVAVEEK